MTSSSPQTTNLVDVTMPQMGVSVAEGTVVEWKKKVGDWVERDEIVCSISTDKIDTDVESPASGRLEELLVDVDQTVEVGTVMARIATDAKPGEPHAAETVSENGSTTEKTQQQEVADSTSALGNERSTQKSAGVGVPAGKVGSSHRYSPVVARIASEHGVDLSQVKGTGREGRVRKQDVLAYIERAGTSGKSATEEEPPLHIESPYRPEPVSTQAAASTPIAASTGEFQEARAIESGPLSRVRRSIGRHMLESLRTTATCTTVVEIDMSHIEIARKSLGLTYLPFVAHCTVQTLREFPQLNATLAEDTFTTYEDVNLGIAVSLGDEGLIVPVINHAHNYSVEGLSEKIKELARKARANQLSPDDVQGGTFTITNPGGFGSIIATPVINQPQVAILDTEAVVKRAVVVTDELGQDAIVIRPMTYFCMSWDHRALDGALAAQFLAALRNRIETWPVK